MPHTTLTHNDVTTMAEVHQTPGIYTFLGYDDDSYPDVVVSCATRPVPPSLLVAANQPKYASEYYAAGAFEDAGPV